MFNCGKKRKMKGKYYKTTKLYKKFIIGNAYFTILFQKI